MKHKCHCPNSPNTAPGTQNDCHDWSWNVIYNARNNRWHPPTSPNTAPATQIDSGNFPKNFSKTAEMSFPMRGRSEQDPTMIREWSENDPTMKPSLRNPPRNRGYFSRPPRAFCIEKYNISRSGYHSKFHRILRLPRKVTRQLHRILRQPRKTTLMINPRHTWNAIYNARSNKCPNSPNTAPATKNESHDWSLSHMRRYLQCAEQQVSLSKLTKYCACHEKWISWLIVVTHETQVSLSKLTKYCAWHTKWLSWLILKRYLQCAEQQMASSNITEYCACHANWLWKLSQKFLENCWNVISNAGPIRAGSENDPTMIREWSENDPTMKPSLRNPPRNRGYFSRPPRAFCIEKYNISRSGYHSKFHRILRLPRKVTLQLHRILRLPRKVTLERHQMVHLPRKVTLERHQIVHLPRKVTLRYSTLL